MVDELEKVATDPNSWEALWRRYGDGSYWLETYPKSERHGGGSPDLERIEDAAAARFLARLREQAS